MEKLPPNAMGVVSPGLSNSVDFSYRAISWYARLALKDQVSNAATPLSAVGIGTEQRRFLRVLAIGGVMMDELSFGTGLFFEVQPKPGLRQAYFDHVDRLNPILAGYGGLLWLKRYTSVNDPDLILSHQLWESEGKLMEWRRDQKHRSAQIDGIKNIFIDYRIRVGQHIWNWVKGTDAALLPVFAIRKIITNPDYILTLNFNTPVNVASKKVDFDITGYFESLGEVEGYLLIGRLKNLNAGMFDVIADSGAVAAALFTITRDYGLFNRAEAPLPR